MKKKMIIAGGTGFLGRELTNYFKSAYNIYILTRGRNRVSNGIRYVNWDGRSMGSWMSILDNASVLINLNGKSVDCRYTNKNKQMIYDTRIESTAVLGLALQQSANPPKVWLNASSATIYRDSRHLEMDEYKGELGHDFSEDVCIKWEESFNQSNNESVRRVALRTGIVLGHEGGPLKPLKMLASTGFGGRQGSGEQFCSWLHAEDFCRAVDFLINDENASGVFNVTAPIPVPNSLFMQALTSSLKVPLAIPMPKWLLELGAIFIRTETELILKSRRVIPLRLKERGFEFKYERIQSACDNLC